MTLEDLIKEANRASYTGAGLGHEYTLAYSTKTGAAAVVNQK